MKEENPKTLADRIKEIYPDISEDKLIDIGETIVFLAKEGLKIDDIMDSLKQIEEQKKQTENIAEINQLQDSLRKKLTEKYKL